ncbi:hypothetical protein AXG93_3217s1610 [Marchantia polymorpha subsp. ruderalis]|uniref:U-box domain-containing protein n=1 Tax=Marchantia polymorpha subsp. ruderalis TaxID=1480154 RepID=A0A176VWF8_MARPO|nr:hypothetical protein AXG93_3217s1610 [Marchantia polymorpha subsp. ruderalis]
MEPVSLTVSLAQTLLQTVTRAITWWNQTENAEVAEELSLFAKNLKHNIGVLSWRKVAKNTTSTYAIGTLTPRPPTIQTPPSARLRDETDFHNFHLTGETQKRAEKELSREAIETIVTLDNKEMQKFHAAVDRMQAELVTAYATTNAASTRKELKAHMRKDLQEMFVPLLAAMRSHGQSIEEVICIIKGDERQAQTDDLEKIFADLVAAAHERDGPGSSSSSRRDKTTAMEPVSSSGFYKSNTLKWYHDPITWEVMCDPVKASDRRTYDRWTLIHHASSMKLSPFDRSPHLQIIFDDIDVRSRLFQKYPEQEEIYRTLRSRYRQQALEKANGEDCNPDEVLVMLNHVLAWAENDDECRAKRDEMLMRVSRSNNDDMLSSSSSGSVSNNPMQISSSNSSIDSPEFPQLMSWLERAYAEKTKGDAAFSEGNYGEAVEYFTSAIFLAPLSESLYSKRSASNAFLHNYQEALEDAKIALELNPDWAEGYLRLATAYQGMKNHREAIAAYKKGLESDPTNEAIKSGLAAAQGAHWKEKGFKFICSQSHLLYLVISFLTLRVLQKISP